MDLVKILYQPYVIVIFLSLLITLITYFIFRNKNINNIDDEKNNGSNDISKVLLYTFIISFLILFGLNYLLKYMNDNKFFQKGGVIKNIADNLTIVADDVDYGILED
jgi:uncharacterized membrane protein